MDLNPKTDSKPPTESETRPSQDDLALQERLFIRRYLQQCQRKVLRNLGLYLILSIIYIYVSDFFLFTRNLFLSDHQISLIKGWLFVFASCLFFYFALRQRNRAFEDALNTIDRQEQNLVRAQNRDSVTGLWTRKRLEVAIGKRLRRNEEPFGLLYLNIDDFRLVNESGGYQVGNELLRHVGKTLDRLCQSGCMAARLSADEFAILLDTVRDSDDFLDFADRIKANLRRDWEIDGSRYYLTLSAGAAIVPEHTETTEGLIQCAEMAMLNSKALGKNHTSIYYPGIRSRQSQQTAQVTELRQAIELRQFELHFQPLYRLDDGKLRGTEALLRRRPADPNAGLIYPDEFIPLAEATGLIHPLTQIVVELACAQCQIWQEQGLMPLILSINISSQQLQHEQLFEQIQPLLKLLEHHGCQLELEITEGVLIDNPKKAIDRILSFKKQGIRFALDDFGTGYSSLTWLRQLPVDVVKIDRQFIQTMLHNSQDAKIIRSIVELVHNLNLQVVAEGIETQDQLAELTQIGCDYGQGYLMARPQAAPQLELLLRQKEFHLASSAPGQARF